MGASANANGTDSGDANGNDNRGVSRASCCSVAGGGVVARSEAAGGTVAVAGALVASVGVNTKCNVCPEKKNQKMKKSLGKRCQLLTPTTICKSK